MFELIPRFDTARMESVIHTLIDVAKNDSIPQVSTTYIRELPKLYAEGLGGDGLPLPSYSDSYAKRNSISLTPKTLKRTDGRLYDMVLDGNLLTVKESDFTSAKKDGTTRTVSSRVVAHGQQTGGTGKWGYSNIMFGANQPLQSQAAEELASFITERIAA
ncbi:MAG TPA: hypothetical protein VGM92_04830 [Candidatus Kapabacteria bacterium]|jgi:hypothetical protein